MHAPATLAPDFHNIGSRLCQSAVEARTKISAACSTAAILFGLKVTCHPPKGAVPSVQIGRTSVTSGTK